MPDCRENCTPIVLQEKSGDWVGEVQRFDLGIMEQNSTRQKGGTVFTVMQKYAEIIIDISHEKLDHPFTYRIPEALLGKLAPGDLVEIPFGQGNKRRTGYVVALTDRCSCDPSLIKEILAAAEQHAPTEQGRAIELADWMRRRYGSTMITALKTVLPVRHASKPLEKKEIRLLLSEEEAAAKCEFYRKKHQTARERLLESLRRTPCQPYELVTKRLHISAQTLRAMKEDGVLAIDVEKSLRNPAACVKTEKKQIDLSPEQQAAVQSVCRDLDEGKSTTTLLYGITGSGKTEVYIAVIEHVISLGRQAIMLIPEIALTYQTLLRFYRHFGDRVSVLHSALSEGEKADQFERARRGEIDVIIGPRSALFTPFPDPGVIVMDEEHENSYKNENMPKYHTREVAEHMAKRNGACLLLGSATPSLGTYYQAMQGRYRLCRLERRLTGGVLPQVQIVDLRQELKEGNRSIFSRSLQDLIIDRLARREQVILFLNRRGFAGFVSCRSCGHVLKCPHCDVALTQHGNTRMVCHYCGYEQPLARHCPECGSQAISGFRAGTEQVEQMLGRAFPDARVLRMDADTTRKKGDYDKILSAFANEEADILIGTQMIVKGHDFPNVTLVGILCADLSLYGNDYRAAERTFQLLTQAAGRAGRGKRPGEVVIQTYQPEHYSIRHAAAQDYEGFYREEMQYRSLMLYPPVWHMLAIQIQGKDEDTALGMANHLRALFEKARMQQKEMTEAEKAKTQQDGTAERGDSKTSRTVVLGPAPASLGRARDFYRFVIYVKDQKYDTLIEWKDRAEQAVKEARFSKDVQVQFDFDPVNPF